MRLPFVYRSGLFFQGSKENVNPSSLFALFTWPQRCGDEEKCQLEALANRCSSFAILPTGRTKSTQPEAWALSGMPSISADMSWAKVVPPFALMCLHPSVPSPSYPENRIVFA
jgi:hypothetical protein